TKATEKIESVSISKGSGNNVEEQITTATGNIFQTIKIIIGALLIFYIIYTGVMMIISMGDNEDYLTKSKRSIWYSLIALVFINIPGTIYDSISGKQTGDDLTSVVGSGVDYNRNIFINTDIFGTTLGNLMTFLQTSIASFAVIIIILSGIKMLFSLGEMEKVNEAKNKLGYYVAVLFFLGLIETWKKIIFTNNFSEAGNLFGKLSNLALFFAGPIAIFFLSLAGYYFITSAGNEDRQKKAKSILINTVFATLILIGIYTFFGDLNKLSF
ncbi:MAG: hypothetical protein NWP80_00805, partial [Candidatus Gracilibacteria bacterium]|nr:hypothetical protein [Candidatus Gracilibacteria bacterium]